MAEPDDMIIPMLREMRAEMAHEFGQVEKRLEALESGQRNIRSALVGEAYAVELNALIEIGPTDVDADLDVVDAAFSIVSLRRRLSALEQRVRELEAHK